MDLYFRIVSNCFFRLKNLTCLIFFISIGIYAQEPDIWSGTYELRGKDTIKVMDLLKIKKTKNENKKDVLVRYHSDLKRWIIVSKNDNYEDKVKVRQFVYDLKEDRNEYEEFGWTKLYLKGAVKCIDAGHFFICKTKPKSKVTIDKESFYTETGIWGIRLHYGLFQLRKIEDTEE